MSDHSRRRRTPWMSWGACLHADPELFFPAATGVTGAGQAREAKEVCASCQVRAACLAYALATRQEHGIWGGATEKERRAMGRSWHRITSLPRWDGTAAGFPPAGRERVAATLGVTAAGHPGLAGTRCRCGRSS